MTSLQIKIRRSAVVVLLGVLLLNYPLMSLFNLDAMIFGIPLLYLYLFGVWMLLIILTRCVSRTRQHSSC